MVSLDPRSGRNPDHADTADLCQLQTIGGDPEQLFAAGWSASFEGAMAFAARKMSIALPADLARYIESQA